MSSAFCLSSVSSPVKRTMKQALYHHPPPKRPAQSRSPSSSCSRSLEEDVMSVHIAHVSYLVLNFMPLILRWVSKPPNESPRVEIALLNKSMVTMYLSPGPTCTRANKFDKDLRKNESYRCPTTLVIMF